MGIGRSTNVNQQGNYMPFPVSAEFIVAEELKLGASLPSTFRDYLGKSNGGEIAVLDDVWQIIPVFDQSDRKRAARTTSNLSRELAAAKGWSNFPHEAIPFAANGTGNILVFLKVEEMQYGELVYLWNHEDGSLEKVADSFRKLNIAN